MLLEKKYGTSLSISSLFDIFSFWLLCRLHPVLEPEWSVIRHIYFNWWSRKKNTDSVDKKSLINVLRKN